MVWRSTSPMLAEMDAAMLHECPVGMILREGPHVYDLARAGGLAEQSGIEVLGQPRYLQDALMLVAAERSRLRELADLDRQAKNDARHGARVLKGRR